MTTVAVSDDENNVIYANFGARTRVTRAEDVTRVDALTFGPAANRVWQAVTTQSDQGRIKRGRQYADAGHVVELQIRPGSASAAVAGSQNEPFHVQIVLPYRSPEEITTISTTLARTSNGMTRARRGVLDGALLDLLIAGDTDDLRFACDCPDHVRACKHAVAASLKLAEKMDADPGAVFQLRGMNLHDLEKMVLTDSLAVAAEATEEGSSLFFTGRPLPALPEPKTAPAIDDSDLDLLHKAMRSVSFTNVDQLRAVSDIEDLYDTLTDH